MSTVDPSTATLSSQNTCGSATNPGTAIPDGTPLVIANCRTAHIFRAATDDTENTSGGSDTSSLGKTYNANVSEIMRFRSYTYYIRFNPSNQPALYRYDNNTNTSLELVEGVENMQILYGLDTIRTPPSSANQYVDSTSVGNWSQVVSVRVTLTLRSVGENSDNLTNVSNAARSYNGRNDYVDRRVVKTFVATISLRNRMQ
jgi:type IV pilus assembly protein PilW